MRAFLLTSLLFLLVFPAAISQQQSPDKIYGDLFREVQLRKIFPDGKTFVDCIPRQAPAAIMAEYTRQKGPALDLRQFVEQHFILPSAPAVSFSTDTSLGVQTHIARLWQVLKRNPDTSVAGSSLLPLPYSYVVPGGRFREIYYWDSYFTMLGLQESNEYEMIENMIRNFAYLINQYGFIPNGNRTYYLSRSQPPFFSAMIQLLAESRGKHLYAIYRQSLEREYEYWMDKNGKTSHIVRMPDGSTLNRYYDQLDIPRQESYREDVETADLSKRDKQQVYRHLRSGAESGWDFSSRWLSDGRTLASINTTNYVPVDLNCLLYNLEMVLSRAHLENGDRMRERYYRQLAERRKAAINKYCWSATLGFYVDYNIQAQTQSSHPTLAGMTPFFFGLAPEARSSSAAKLLQRDFLKRGGLVTTLRRSGQQWDAPNGWAPLQWIAVAGLEKYGMSELAKTIAHRWISLNQRVYRETGKRMEKYNVEDAGIEAGGGEYPSQDGFGWTNGVLLKMIKTYGLPSD